MEDAQPHEQHSPRPGSAPRRWMPTPFSPSSPRVHPEPRTQDEELLDLPTLASHDSEGAERKAQEQRIAAVRFQPQEGPAAPEAESTPPMSPLRRSVSRAMQSFSALIKDDDKVVDKWHARSNSVGSSFRPSGLPSRASVADLNDDCAGGDSVVMAQPSLRLSRQEIKLMIKQYLVGLATSVLISAINVPFVYAWSRLKWSNTNAPTDRPVYTLNTSVFQLSLLLQAALPLSLYALVMYACIKATWRLPRALVGSVFATMSLAIVVAVLFWKYDVPFWFYSGDFIYIALTYVPAMCIVGWFLAEEGATTRERLGDMLMVAVLETVVAAAAILYCQLLMPLFFMVGPWMQLAWVCIFHPIYFELTTAVLLRIVLRRNALKGRTNVRWFLSIVHAGVHSVSISCILTSSIDTLQITVLTQALLMCAKLVWRSTTNLRDIWIERLRRWDFTYTHDFMEQCQQNRLVATGVITEMILENACNILAPWLIWCTWHIPIFMSVAPTVLIQGGTYPVYYVIVLILILVAVTAIFDISFLLLNYATVQQLPIIQTFREIRQAGAWYVGFLAIAITFMGVLFLFISMILVPRAVFCWSNNYCDCRLAPLQGICDGEYISTWGGNVI